MVVPSQTEALWCHFHVLKWMHWFPGKSLFLFCCLRWTISLLLQQLRRLHHFCSTIDEKQKNILPVVFDVFFFLEDFLSINLFRFEDVKLYNFYCIQASPPTSLYTKAILVHTVVNQCPKDVFFFFVRFALYVFFYIYFFFCSFLETSGIKKISIIDLFLSGIIFSS